MHRGDEPREVGDEVVVVAAPSAASRPLAARIDVGGLGVKQADAAARARRHVVDVALRDASFGRAVVALHRRADDPVLHLQVADPARLEEVGEAHGEVAGSVGRCGTSVDPKPAALSRMPSDWRGSKSRRSRCGGGLRRIVVIDGPALRKPDFLRAAVPSDGGPSCAGSHGDAVVDRTGYLELTEVSVCSSVRDVGTRRSRCAGFRRTSGCGVFCARSVLADCRRLHRKSDWRIALTTIARLRALVTGATGGIGRATCLALLDSARARRLRFSIAAAASKPGPTLDSLVAELVAQGAEALAVPPTLRTRARAPISPRAPSSAAVASTCWCRTRASRRARRSQRSSRRTGTACSRSTCARPGCWRGRRARRSRRAGARSSPWLRYRRYYPFPGLGAYSPAKAALVMLCRQLAQEWAPDGIRVNSVSPGLIRTPLTEPIYRDAELLRRRQEAIPLGRIGTAEDVACAIVHLASPAAELRHRHRRAARRRTGRSCARHDSGQAANGRTTLTALRRHARRRSAFPCPSYPSTI